ncbi:MAG: hypothetical protein U5K79_10825 [Cyclobacteriaceae bacterium]|nr:hypothetical protein [Cyclobacteriaceae bacterium]
MKTFIKIIIIVLILFGTIYFGANYILKKVAVKAVEYLQPRLEDEGIQIVNFDYRTVRLASYNQCNISDIDLDFRLNKEMFGKESFSANVKVKTLKIRFADFKRPSLFFEIADFSLFVVSDERSAGNPFGRLENAQISSRLPVYLKNPYESAKDVLAEVKALFRESKSHVDLNLSTTVYLGLDDKELGVRLFSFRENDTTYIRFNADDILLAAHSLELDMGQAEAEIIAAHPGKSPKLIKITRDAKRLSKLEIAQDNSFPEDAYKHIYWSYHLAREFGPELTKEITDAHETNPGNTRQERLMDFHNNEIGRGLAGEQLSEADLKELVLTSPKIIRNPLDIE